MPKSKKPRKAMDPKKILEKDRIGYPTYKPVDDTPLYQKHGHGNVNFKTK